MAYKHIFTRAPFFTQLSTAQTNVSLELRMWTGDVVSNRPGTAQYTLSKEVTDGAATFEIAELIRGYNQHTSTKTTGHTWVETTLDDGVAAATVTTYIASEGYTLYQDGIQADTTVAFEKGIALPADTDGSYRIMLPESTAGDIPVKFDEQTLTDLSNFTLYEPVTTVATIKTVDLDDTITPATSTVHIDRMRGGKYSPIKLVFLNKRGFKQDFYFTLKSAEGISASSDSFTRSLMDYNALSNGNGLHAKRKRIKNVKQKFSVNTDFIKEYYVKQIEELLLSEYVWITWEGVLIPVNVVTSSLDKKTHLNDKLINYTLELETASDYLNIVR